MRFSFPKTEGVLGCNLPRLVMPRCLPNSPVSTPRAVLFFSLKTEGVLDRGSLHGSCPTTKGTKFAATKW